MLEIALDLPIRVQNGGLFISRGIGVHPSRKLSSWELIFVEKGTLAIREDDTSFSVSEGEILLLQPQRSHRGLETFPLDLKFYWLHFDINAFDIDEIARKYGRNSSTATLLSIPQHCKVHDPQYITSLFRQHPTASTLYHRISQRHPSRWPCYNPLPMQTRVVPLRRR